MMKNMKSLQKFTMSAPILEEIKAALQEAGMTFVASYNAFTRQPPDKNSERIYIVAQENGKQTA